MKKYTPYGVILTNIGDYTQYGVYTNVTSKRNTTPITLNKPLENRHFMKMKFTYKMIKFADRK